MAGAINKYTAMMVRLLLALQIVSAYRLSIQVYAAKVAALIMMARIYSSPMKVPG